MPVYYVVVVLVDILVSILNTLVRKCMDIFTKPIGLNMF